MSPKMLATLEALQALYRRQAEQIAQRQAQRDMRVDSCHQRAQNTEARKPGGNLFSR